MKSAEQIRNEALVIGITRKLEELNSERAMLVKWLHKLQGGSVKLLPDDVRPSSNGTKPARKRGGVYGPDNPHWTQLAKNKAKLRRVTKLANAAAVAANTGTTRK